MKVFHIDSEKTFRGGQRQVLYLLEGLNGRGVENFLFCPRKSPLFERAGWVNKISAPMLGEFDIFSAFKISGHINREKPDIIHCHSAHALAVGLLAKKLSSFKPALVAARRVIFPLRCRKKYIMADRIIAISAAVKKSLEASGIAPVKIDIVYSGIRPSAASRDMETISRKLLGLKDGVFTIAVVGALTKEKGHSIIIDAVSEVLARGFKLELLIAGTGPEEKKLRRYATGKGIAENVLFAGFQKNILELFPAFNIVISASDSEGLGTSILDAMAAGCAVIASDVGGVPEIIEDSVNGFLFKAGDASALAEKIIALASDAGMRRAMAEAGRSRAAEFSSEKTADATFAVYEKILNERKK